MWYIINAGKQKYFDTQTIHSITDTIKYIVNIWLFCGNAEHNNPTTTDSICTSQTFVPSGRFM